MGLDNIPQPYVCKVKGYAKMVKVEDREVIDCDATNCPFKERFNWIVGFLGTYCWLRGKAYSIIADEVGFSLYDELGRDQVESLYRALKDRERELSRKYGERYSQLVNYLETLLEAYGDLDFKLVAWY